MVVRVVVLHPIGGEAGCAAWVVHDSVGVRRGGGVVGKLRARAKTEMIREECEKTNGLRAEVRFIWGLLRCG